MSASDVPSPQELLKTSKHLFSDAVKLAVRNHHKNGNDISSAEFQKKMLDEFDVHGGRPGMRKFIHCAMMATVCEILIEQNRAEEKTILNKRK